MKKIKDILTKIKKESFNQYDYSFEYEKAFRENSNHVSFQEEDGYIILDEDNDSTCIEYKFTYDEQVTYGRGSYNNPPTSDSNQYMVLTVELYVDDLQINLNDIDEKRIKSKIYRVIKF